jgi:hypothetical protein
MFSRIKNAARKTSSLAANTFRTFSRNAAGQDALYVTGAGLLTLVEVALLAPLAFVVIAITGQK